MDEVPQNGGLVVAHANIVLTRDKNDQIRAFSAICTHQGCTVANVAKNKINCPCHGSRFDATTGHPIAGPAKKPLSIVPIKIDNGVITTGR
ncbi:Rieske (2Fe-2S) protein [Streptomyces sp. NPDC005574]|uniref:Rieske (2Fe-2S) protein n=1 Tax=Streptomyces sp. NPDC005574 TaxID=3156891 RepID=UPI0033BCEAE5